MYMLKKKISNIFLILILVSIIIQSVIFVSIHVTMETSGNKQKIINKILPIKICGIYF